MAAMKVAIRVRPSSKESVVYCDPHVSTHIKTDINRNGFTFATVLGQESTQREAYLECGLPMLEAALQGQRACLFAYGQTGSGKTFSLLGAEGGKNPHKLDGIVPQMASELFRRFAQLESQGIKYNMWASFIEVHNEKARDLIFEGDPEYEQPVLYVPTPAEKVGACRVPRVRLPHFARSSQLNPLTPYHPFPPGLTLHLYRGRRRSTRSTVCSSACGAAAA